MDEYLEYRRFVLMLEPVGYCLAPFDFHFPCRFLLVILFSASCNNNIVDARCMDADVKKIIVIR